MFFITIYFYFVVRFSRSPVAHLSLISYLSAVLVYLVHVPALMRRIDLNQVVPTSSASSAGTS